MHIIMPYPHLANQIPNSIPFISIIYPSFPKAICCSDHLHCCPGGYKCDLAASTCTQGNKTVAMVTKKPANQVADINDITCPGGQMSCPGGTTCCKLQSGGWGCCPMPKVPKYIIILPEYFIITPEYTITHSTLYKYHTVMHIYHTII